jgi:hypothetical protein
MKFPAFLCISIYLLVSHYPVKAQSFERWFDEGVMRIDLEITGTSDHSTYAFSGIRKEPHYSGSRTILLDPFNYGDHKLVIKDSVSGTPIFSYTYCSLFREWQTTSEAKTLRRAFNHVVRFPWPRNPVQVEIHDRQKDGNFKLNWSGTFSPKTIYADPVNSQQFETVDIEINGPDEQKVDLLFLAEGYTVEEMEKFMKDVDRSVGFIFSEEPFNSNRDAFNIRAVKSISKDPGTDIPADGVWKSTVMNSSFYTFGLERYMTTLDYKTVCDVASNAPYDQIYILVNISKYGGGGMYNMYAISAADNEESRAVVVHEFGHAFAGLADEYYKSEVAYNDFFNLEVEPWNPNLTTLVDFQSKWEGQIHGGIPIPTPADDQYKDEVGVFEGGGYVTHGVYRPMIDCMMHSNEASFCPVCQRAILQMIKRYTAR